MLCVVMSAYGKFSFLFKLKLNYSLLDYYLRFLSFESYLIF